MLQNCLKMPWSAKEMLQKFLITASPLFELGRQASPGRQTGIRLYRPVPAEGQNKSWGLICNYISGETRKQQISISLCLTQWYFWIFFSCSNFCFGAPWSSALAALSAWPTVPRPSAQTSSRTGRKRLPRVGIDGFSARLRESQLQLFRIFSADPLRNRVPNFTPKTLNCIYITTNQLCIIISVSTWLNT
jgi:hypothetical protein